MLVVKIVKRSATEQAVDGPCTALTCYNNNLQIKPYVHVNLALLFIILSLEDKAEVLHLFTILGCLLISRSETAPDTRQLTKPQAEYEELLSLAIIKLSTVLCQQLLFLAGISL
ncbi:hypothetical protein N483_09130 [Pseudoalteromonas luteoviolacea NCIMB 1944]|uniref:Uncharacterized protein n=1 Tax=Pseudoalteromonas luteoviolacea (strain 2ta16) TaxID=1353533 RepID=V4HXZ8_PSEL2|nr:hypothetical protein PL2TA16_00688 [Pseudoalteromonas luteoviolacea 2ta16]KZN43448.1 hypothetical protein N483_09130 [Pseudoalteromonas luteoviolacea NCIMB 1944]